jgi:cytochrome c5
MTEPTQRQQIRAAAWAFIMFSAGTVFTACETTKPAEGTPPAATAAPQATQQSTAADVAEGQRVFRFETFGDEQLWTAKLHLNEVVEKNVDPTTVLKVGLKVDADALPAGILEKVDLKSPGTTVALLKMNAVVGLQATVDANNHITRLGVTCALCHSTVDNSIMPGIGRRKDGWPNRDLNVGAIIALSPELPADKKAVYASWGRGKYDPRYNQDGKKTPLVLPPAYGLAQVKNETYTAGRVAAPGRPLTRQRARMPRRGSLYRG